MVIKQPACQSVGRQFGVQRADFLSHSVPSWRESAVLAAPGLDAGHRGGSMGTSTLEFHARLPRWSSTLEFRSRIGNPNDIRTGPIHALLLRPDAAHCK